MKKKKLLLVLIDVLPRNAGVGVIWGPPNFGDPHPHITSCLRMRVLNSLVLWGPHSPQITRVCGDRLVI